MKWSFSHAKTFRKCQLQWYLGTRFASAVAKKDPLQREAYLLSKLQSVFAWRGNLVDKIISEHVIPAFSQKRPLTTKQVLVLARHFFDKQLTFARARRWREQEMTAEKAGPAYAALYGIEYDIDLSEELKQAWNDVEQALRNFLEMHELLSELRIAVKLIPQRNLSFDHFGVTVKARPDLLAFFRDEPPMIVDWKVHSFAQHDYRLQLAVYALALKRSKAHNDFDFPSYLSPYSAADVRLIEAQLLTQQLREHSLIDDDFDEIENYISDSSTQMLLVVGDDEDVEDEDMFGELSTAYHPEICERCNFRRFCWERTFVKQEVKCPVSKQMSFLY
jgi:hypothetical protein